MFTSEISLNEVYQQVISPFWQQKVQRGDFKVGPVNIAYAYVLHPAAIGSLVISSGRIETLLKYKELVYDFYQQGYSVFIHDHRGQGLSTRLIDNSQMGYIATFDDYVSDFKIFMDDVVTPMSVHKASLVCHSMGGTIGALLVMAHPNMFKSVVFSAPMFGIRPVLPSWLANLLLNFHNLVSLLRGPKCDYFFGQGDYENIPFEDNDLTHSQVRYQLFRQEYEYTPKAKLGGVTGLWLRAALLAMNKVEQYASNFPIPALVLQAGADTVVDNVRQTKVAKKMSNTQQIVIDNAKHELFQEQDCFRLTALQAAINFINLHE